MRPVDLARIAICFAVVPAIGFHLKRFAATGEDFFMAGRGMTGNVSAFSTGWTRDIHRPPVGRAFGDRRYVTEGRFARWRRPVFRAGVGAVAPLAVNIISLVRIVWPSA